jgi:hypothetical protein
MMWSTFSLLSLDDDSDFDVYDETVSMIKALLSLREKKPLFAAGEGKNARDRDDVVNCISRRRQKDDREKRTREITRGKNEAFSAQI